MAESKGSMIKFASDSAEISGYLVVPKHSGKMPCLIILQEFWGLNDHIKSICDRYAKEGFITLGVDLYSRQGNKVTTDAQEASKLMQSMKYDETMKDIKSAVDYLKALEVSNGKVGCLGFCVGGSYTILSASKELIDAAFAFYGVMNPTRTALGHPVSLIDEAQYVSCPLIYVYAEKDAHISKEQMIDFEENLKHSEKEFEVVRIPDADHAFFNDTRPEVYNKQRAEEMYRKSVEFFKKHLQ